MRLLGYLGWLLRFAMQLLGYPEWLQGCYAVAMVLGVVAKVLLGGCYGTRGGG